MRGVGAPGRAGVSAVLLVGVVLLGGCTSDEPGATGTGSESASASPSAASPSMSGTPAPTPTWSGTETLSPEQLQAFEEATQTVLAYRQTIVDLYSGARDDLNDLYFVATGDLVDQNLRNIQRGLGEGRRIEPDGAEVHLVSASPRIVSIDADPPSIVVRACIDSTKATAVAPDGTKAPGRRELSDYTLTQKTGGTASDWSVTRIQADPDEADRAC